jgi:hypothetical protein
MISWCTTDRDKGLIVDGPGEPLHDHAINTILLHPLEVQVDDAVAGAVIELGGLAIGQREGGVEEAVGRILADVRDEVNFNFPKLSATPIPIY